ncbi:MAG: DNA polymerase III subunit alpha, partial [[Clostridium] innocuum]
DPIRYHLLFERFLNPERISMPDIDTDFPDNRRDEVIHYVEQLYGKHRVSHIITFNTLAAKQVLRDVGKAMEINPRQIDRLCKLVPNVIKVTLDYAYQNDARFKELINSGETMRRLYATARKLEGLPRHASLHAAGIVFSDEAIEQVCPLIDVDEGVCATQFTMEYLEELGLIKMDFLGLRNLTIIDEIVQHINATADKKLDIMRIPLDDAKTYALIRAVDTVGVFQLESEGMKNLIRKMQPNCFEDIVATIALFRPGPMENIPEYLDRREHPEKVDYIHPSLQPILQNTYGIMIYQEQIMQVAQTMAGFTLGKADNLRKAISKKKGEELRRMQEEFISGALRKGYDEALAQKVYALIMKFANYGFNRSHSVAYGMIAYQLAYLKANAPLYFFNSLLNSVIGSETKTSEYVFEARKRNIQILLPDVNRSHNQYGIEDNALRFPFVGIKGIGSAVSSLIVEERDKKGEFRDFFDFTARMNGNKIGKKTIEILIYAGALDCFKVGRASLMASLEDALRYADLVKIEDVDQVLFDFDLVSKPAMTMMRDNATIRSEKEKEAIGFYLSRHPIADVRSRMGMDLPILISLPKYKGRYVKFVCLVDRCRQYRTKNGDMMMFVIGSDETGKFDLVCMPNIYRQHADDLVKGNYLYVEGIVDKETSCLVKKLTRIEKE